MFLTMNQPVYALLEQQGVSFYLEGVIQWANMHRDRTIQNYTVLLIDEAHRGQHIPVAIDHLYPRFEELATVSMLMVGRFTAQGQIMQVFRRPTDNMPVYRVKPFSWAIQFDIPLDEARSRLELL